MGAAEQQQFTQYPYKYGDGLRGAAIAQTRDGKDELITPVAFWELDAASGLYLPPGMSSNPRKPRVEATLTGRNVQSQTVLPRAVRTAHTLFTVTVPAGAVACLIQYRIYSVTGTNPETRLRSFLAAPIAPNETHAHFDELSHDWVSSAGSQVSLRGMGVATTDLGASGEGNQALASRARLTTHLRLNVFVRGTFGDGEGVDGEVVILWLF